MAPFDVSSLAGTLPYFLIFTGIGLAFGAVLEMAGFGDSRKLAGQFYMGDMTVLKVMFTAIVVACVLIFGATGLGLLDFDKLWVNPTYLVPGIVGGLIMGVGFIVGGYCPGTSLVAASTLKLDGIAFVGGVTLGTGLFSESAALLGEARHATFMGRFTLYELFKLPAGVTVVLLSLMALVMFYGAEIAERAFGAKKKITLSSLIPSNPRHLLAGATLLGMAVVVAFIGQPDAADKFNALEKKGVVSLSNRDVFVHPAEITEWRGDPSVAVDIIDVRSQADFNRFHLRGASNRTLAELTDIPYLKKLKGRPDNHLLFLMSNDESTAVSAFKLLRGSGVSNLYIAEGGLNRWLDIYPPDSCIARKISGRTLQDEKMHWDFTVAVGDGCYAAHPEFPGRELATRCFIDAHPDVQNLPPEARPARPVPFDASAKISFKHKVKLKKKGAVRGGCG